MYILTLSFRLSTAYIFELPIATDVHDSVAVSESKKDEALKGKLCITSLELPLSSTQARVEAEFNTIEVGASKLVFPMPKLP